MRRGAVRLAASLGLALALSCASVSLGAPRRPAPSREFEIPTRVAGGVAGDESLATGTVPLSALHRKTITLHLTRAPAVVPSGAFAGSVRSHITVKLTREKVIQHVFRLAF